MKVNRTTKKECKKRETNKLFNKAVPFLSLFFLIGFLSCKKFLDVEPPNARIPTEDVFANDDIANAAIVGIYLNMYTSGFASGDAVSVASLAGLSADELHNVSLQEDPATVAFETNDLLSNNIHVLNLWISLYKSIYEANAAIEGVQASPNITAGKKDQFLGEALFIRAFCHFYLVQLFGDVPYISITNYNINAKTPRTAQSVVYNHVEDDLLEAERLLPQDHTGPRIRPVKAAATALLARLYLYTNDWQKAEEHASNLINQSGTYILEVNLDNIFLNSSREAIWQLKPHDNASYTKEGLTFSPSGSLQNVLADSLVRSFQLFDKRKTSWITGVGNMYLPYKYKLGTITDEPSTEYSVVFRLAEQYFIRAEARAHLDIITGSNSAESDINAIRHRAGLPDTIINNTVQDALLVIERERKLELFSEWGHRWFDLKRWNRSTEVLSSLKSGWTVHDVLYPIPQEEISRNPFLKPQNPGYE